MDTRSRNVIASLVEGKSLLQHVPGIRDPADGQLQGSKLVKALCLPFLEIRAFIQNQAQLELLHRLGVLLLVSIVFPADEQAAGKQAIVMLGINQAQRCLEMLCGALEIVEQSQVLANEAMQPAQEI